MIITGMSASALSPITQHYCYGVDIKIRSIDAPLSGRGTILFQLQDIGSCTLDFDTRAISADSGVFLLLEDVDPDDLVQREKRKLDLFFVLSEDVDRADLLARAEFAISLTAHRPLRHEHGVCTLASVTTEGVVYHGKGCSTMIGFITLCLSVVRIPKTCNSVPLRAPSTPRESVRVLEVPPGVSGVGMMAAVEFLPPRPTVAAERSPPLASGAMNMIATEKAVTRSADRATQVEDLCISLGGPATGEGGARKGALRPPKVSRSTDAAPVVHYIERDQATGAERSMVFVPGYSESARPDGMESESMVRTSGRFSFCTDDCAHHPPTSATIKVRRDMASAPKPIHAAGGISGSRRPLNSLTSKRSSQSTRDASIYRQAGRGGAPKKGKPARTQGPGRRQPTGRKPPVPAPTIAGVVSAREGPDMPLPHGHSNVVSAVSEEEHEEEYSAPKMSSVFVVRPAKGTDSAAGAGTSWWPLEVKAEIKA